MSNTKLRKTAYVIARVPNETAETLSRLAYMRGITNSDAVREALDAWIAHEQAVNARTVNHG